MMSECDLFMWDVAEEMGRTDLVLDPTFQQFCLNRFDLMTVEQAAESWYRV